MFSDRWQALHTRHQTWSHGLQAAEDRLHQGERDLIRLLEDLTWVRQAVTVLQAVLDRLRVEDEDRLAAVATAALRQVFPDQKLTFKPVATIHRRQSALNLILRDEVRRCQGDPLESAGGGPASILGIVLQIAAILRRPHLARILLLDEPCTAVSPEYQAEAGQFLRQICRDLGFAMLVITHSRDLAAAADRHYVAVPTPVGVRFDLQEPS